MPFTLVGGNVDVVAGDEADNAGSLATNGVRPLSSRPPRSSSSSAVRRLNLALLQSHESNADTERTTLSPRRRNQYAGHTGRKDDSETSLFSAKVLLANFPIAIVNNI
jgi:hypothetical protein